jgi:uncharacterized membrane protein
VALLLALLTGLAACGSGTAAGGATNDAASGGGLGPIDLDERVPTDDNAAGGGSDADSATDENRAEATPEGSDIVIPIADITSTARFYPTTVGGTAMEVLAVKAPDGSIRTAFNPCQVCFDSGRGYYEQEGSVLVCQNCGNRFATDDVEIKTGGCNPVPIFEEDKTVTESSITIPVSTLEQATDLFAKWKR